MSDSLTPKQRYRLSAKGKATERAWRAEYKQRPDVKAKHAARQNARYHTPEGQAVAKKYRSRPEVKAKAKAARTTDAHREYHRKYARAAKSRISEEMFDALWLFQKGRCGVCEIPLVRERAQRDHCHDTKTPRGLLCIICNTVEGAIKRTKLAPNEFSKRLTRYLKTPPAKKVKA